MYYLEGEDPSFPSSREKLGRFCGVASNCGDLLTFKIFIPSTKNIIHRSVIRSAAEKDARPNLRALNPNYSGEENEEGDEDSLFSIDVEDAADPMRDSNIKDEMEHERSDISVDSGASLGQDELTLISREDMGKDDPRLMGATTNPEVPDPTSMIGATFPLHTDEGVQRAVVKQKLDDNKGYLVELNDGSIRTVEYNLIMDKINAGEEDDNDRFYTFSDILEHRKKKGKWEVKVKWEGGGYEPTWEPLANMREADPITLAKYAKDNGIEQLPGWKWTKLIKVINPNRLIRTIRRIFKAKRTRKKYQFGVLVPSSIRQALAIDAEQKNSLWQAAIDTEIRQLLEFDTFEILERGERPGKEYQRIPMIMTFAVKHDGRRKCRVVAGGHVTKPATEDVYSTVVQPLGVRCVVYQAEANNLTVWGGDVGNAYLNGYMREKVNVILGAEFGASLEGRFAKIIKSYYGLKTSCARWSKHIGNMLRKLGWFKSECLHDVWMKDCGTHYEYLTVYSDDIIVASKDPKKIFDELEQTYTLKGVGAPDFYLGATVGRVTGDFNDKGSTTTLSAKIYIQNLIAKLEKEIGVLRSYTMPIDPEYRPELDESPLLNEDDHSIYRMLIGSAQWAITLGRIDIQYATTMLSRFGMCPREGHLTAMKKVFGYLKGHTKGKILYDTRHLDTGDVEFFKGSNWKQIYGDVKEDIPKNIPDLKMKPVQVSIYFDASHACDMVTRRSVTGILVFVNGTPMKWYCKAEHSRELNIRIRASSWKTSDRNGY